MDLKRYKPPTGADMQSWQNSMREAFFEAVAPEDMREIVGKLVEDAKKGNQGAIKLLLSYGIGSTTVNVKNAVIVEGGTDQRRPLPPKPAKSLPGTPDRVDDMARRVANGQAIYSPKDRKAE